MNYSAHRPRNAARRRGLSIFEFIGCLTAMIGGVFLGTYYLGVDVKEMAYSALEQAQIVDPRPKTDDADPTALEPKPTAPTSDAAAAAAPQPPAAQPADSQPTDDQPTDNEPTDDQPADAAAPPAVIAPPTPPEATAVPAAPPAGFFTRPELLTDDQRKALTLQYWEAIGVCMQDETKNRTPAIDEDGNWQLFDYLTGRKDGHLKAAAAIIALDMRGVDDHVVAYAKKARTWHDDGAKLFGRAVDLLTDAPTAQLSGPFAQSWQSASTQHRMEERLLGEKQQAVQSYLDHAYATAPAAVAQP